MKNIILFILFTISLLQLLSASECKTDLYYANGIMMQNSEDEARNIWEIRVNDLLSEYPQLINLVNSKNVSYNVSEGLISDLWESFLQKVDLDPTVKATWSGFKMTLGYIPQARAIELFVAASEYAGEMGQEGTLSQQMRKYRSSIDTKHNILVLAHSQGNFFTHQAYNKLKTEYTETTTKKFFHTVAVASPDYSIVNNGHGITFDNDIILSVGPSTNNIPNPNRRDHVYFPRNAIGEIIGPRTLERDVKSVQYHGFEYYLGYPTYETILSSGSTGADAIANPVKMETNIAKNVILQWVYDEILDFDSKCTDTGGGGGGETTNFDYQTICTNLNFPDNISDYEAVIQAVANLHQHETNQEICNAIESELTDMGIDLSGGGGDGGSTDFDFKAECSDIEFADPLPDKLAETIDGILSSNANNLVANIVCPLIKKAVDTYDALHGGGGGLGL